MLKERLPVTIDPVRLAKGARVLAGSLRVTDMRRLSAQLASQEGEVAVELAFGVDQNHVHYVRGRARAELELVCQRCMSPVQLAVDAELSLGVVTSEAAAERLPEHYDPLLFQDEPLHLADIVEDELLLALPIVPKHPEGSCPSQPGKDEGGQATEARQSPFAVLSVLKGGKEGNDKR